MLSSLSYLKNKRSTTYKRLTSARGATAEGYATLKKYSHLLGVYCYFDQDTIYNVGLLVHFIMLPLFQQKTFCALVTRFYV